MKPKQQVFEELRREYLSHENVAKVAYYYWEGAGRPDGSLPRFPDTPGSMTIAEAHWLAATMVMEALAETDAYFCWAFQQGEEYARDNESLEKARRLVDLVEGRQKESPYEAVAQ